MFSLTTLLRSSLRRSPWRDAAVNHRFSSSTPMTAIYNVLENRPSPENVQHTDKNKPRSRKGPKKMPRTKFSPSRNYFMSPQDFTREARSTKLLKRHKPPLLGPNNAVARRHDVFHQLNIDPVDECQNSALMSDFVSSMGKIRNRRETGLTWKSQRRLGKAIRRAKMMGIIPLMSRRPFNSRIEN